MTAYPDPANFADFARTRTHCGVVMHPNVTEHYWGYEVRRNEHVIDLAVLMRAVSGLACIATLMAAFGVWLVPAMAFVSSAVAMKTAVSVLLICLALLLARIAVRGTRVRVQIDTAKGEVREVVDGAFGSEYILAHYGLDGVESVEIVSSRSEPSFGQVQITIAGVGAIGVGDGAIGTLHPLSDRLASDCGHNGKRDAVWAGLLAA